MKIAEKARAGENSTPVLPACTEAGCKVAARTISVGDLLFKPPHSLAYFRINNR